MSVNGRQLAGLCQAQASSSCARVTPAQSWPLGEAQERSASLAQALPVATWGEPGSPRARSLTSHSPAAVYLAGFDLSGVRQTALVCCRDVEYASFTLLPGALLSASDAAVLTGVRKLHLSGWQLAGQMRADELEVHGMQGLEWVCKTPCVSSGQGTLGTCLLMACRSQGVPA